MVTEGTAPRLHVPRRPKTRVRRFARHRSKIMAVRRGIRLANGSRRWDEGPRFVRRPCKITAEAIRGIRVASVSRRWAGQTRLGDNVSRPLMFKAGPTPDRSPRFDSNRTCNHRIFRTGPTRGRLPETVSIEIGLALRPEVFRTTVAIGPRSSLALTAPQPPRRTTFSRSARPIGNPIGTAIAIIGGTVIGAGS